MLLSGGQKDPAEQMWAVVRHQNNRFGLFKLPPPRADGRVLRAPSPGRSASPRGLLVHIKGSPRQLVSGRPRVQTAGPEQNKDDISGFLPDGGTRAVGDDKTQPAAPPSTKPRQFRDVYNVKGNTHCDLLNPVKRTRLVFLCFGKQEERF